jgi:hypothetical protein
MTLSSPLPIGIGNVECGVSGIKFKRQNQDIDEWMVTSQASVESECDSSESEQYLGLAGSFLPPIDGYYEFRVETNTSSGSTMKFRMTFNGTDYGMMETTSVSVIQSDLLSRYRYAWRILQVEPLKCSLLSLLVKPPGWTGFFRVSEVMNDMCEENGCSNLTYEREVYDCMAPISPMISTESLADSQISTQDSPSVDAVSERPVTSLLATPRPSKDLKMTSSLSKSEEWSKSLVLSYSGEFEPSSDFWASNRLSHSVEFSFSSAIDQSKNIHLSMDLSRTDRYSRSDTISTTNILSVSQVNSLSLGFRSSSNSIHSTSATKRDSRTDQTTAISLETEIEPNSPISGSTFGSRGTLPSFPRTYTRTPRPSRTSRGSILPNRNGSYESSRVVDDFETDSGMTDPAVE